MLKRLFFYLEARKLVGQVVGFEIGGMAGGAVGGPLLKVTLGGIVYTAPDGCDTLLSWERIHGMQSGEKVTHGYHAAVERDSKRREERAEGKPEQRGQLSEEEIEAVLAGKLEAMFSEGPA